MVFSKSEIPAVMPTYKASAHHYPPHENLKCVRQQLYLFDPWTFSHLLLCKILHPQPEYLLLVFPVMGCNGIPGKLVGINFFKTPAGI